MKEIIKKIIREELEQRGFVVKKIILFGSRARNEAKDDSDWDIYVVVDKEANFKELNKITTQIKRRLSKLKIPNDVIIRSEKHFNKNRNFIGYISYYADKEGIII